MSMPTQLPLLLLLRRFALCLGPAFFYGLSSTSERKRVRRHLFGDATCGRDVGAAANRYWRHQRRIAADEHAILDDRSVFVDTVVVAGDGARADVHAFTDFRVSQVAEVIRLGTLTQFDFLGLDKIS